MKSCCKNLIEEIFKYETKAGTIWKEDILKIIEKQTL